MSEGRSASGEFRSSLLWRILAAGGGMAASFLLTIVVVRGLDSLHAATFFSILAALSIGPLVGRLGLGANVLRLIPAEDDSYQRRRIGGSHLLATALLSLISAPLIALIGCAGLFGHGEFIPVFLLAALLIAVESTRLMLSDIYAATGNVRASVATMHYVRSILALPAVAVTVFAFGSRSLIVVVAVYLAVAGAQFLVALLHARALVAFPDLREARSTLKIAITQGVRLFSVDLSEFMIMQGTIWLATAILSPHLATQYALAVTLGMQVVLFKNLALLAVGPPAARLLAAGAKDSVIRLLSSAATLGATVAVTLVVLIAAVGPWAVRFAYGADMGPTATMLLIIALGGAVQSCFSVSSTLLIISSHIAEAARVALGVLVVALPSAVLAAFFGGAYVLSGVTAVSLAVMYFGQYVNAKRCFGVAPHAHWNSVAALRELRSDALVVPVAARVQQ